MKTAICISGDMRNYLQTYPNQFENIFSQLDCDIFISSWEDSQTDWNQVISTYQPKVLKIENKQQRGWLIRSNETIALGMFYKIFNCFQMTKESDTSYDAIIRMRPDSFFDRPIIMNDLGSYVWLSGIEKKQRWLEDTFAYGTYSTMERYSALYLDLPQLAQELGYFHPETLLANHLKKQQVPFQQCQITSGTLRESGEINSHYGYSGDPVRFSYLKV
jgi:hypothetical protein